MLEPVPLDSRVRVVPHDPRWAAHFRDIRRQLQAVLGPVAERIEHVGSTAVAGLVAKPVIDVQISVPSLDREDDYRPALESLGYSYLKDAAPEHRFFHGVAGAGTGVHIHVCAAGSPWERRHVAFRDYLQRRPQVATMYGRVKQDAAAKNPLDRQAYWAAKSSLVRSIERDALRWTERMSSARR